MGIVGYEIAKKVIERYNPESVLFCPYKEEMWDCMQTVYDYFADKTNIKTGIMPIAYYTLSNNRITDLKIEFKKHAGNFPMILKGGWDIIFFHYPYDQLNNVTRPLLYSTELKAFCKHLVLLPYAVTNRNAEPNEVVYPGIRNSDLIICETDEQATVSNRLLEGQPGWKGECVGWGSPKFDMIELAEIPEVWKQKAGERRIVLLQTSLIPYLQDRNKMNQTETIIKSYMKNNKVCLVWRPHPLFKDTIIAHRREDLKRFEGLIDLVKQSPKDIFDDTKTAETCIKFADEMLSDESSLVTLWKTTGKKLTMLE